MGLKDKDITSSDRERDELYERVREFAALVQREQIEDYCLQKNTSYDTVQKQLAKYTHFFRVGFRKPPSRSNMRLVGGTRKRRTVSNTKIGLIVDTAYISDYCEENNIDEQGFPNFIRELAKVKVYLILTEDYSRIIVKNKDTYYINHITSLIHPYWSGEVDEFHSVGSLCQLGFFW